MKNQTPYSAQDLAQKAQKLFVGLAVQDEEDTVFFAALVEEFSAQIDVMQQLKLFHAWCLDQHPTKIKNPRFRFRSWLTNAAEYKNRRKMISPPALYTKNSATES